MFGGLIESVCQHLNRPKHSAVALFGAVITLLILVGPHHCYHALPPSSYQSDDDDESVEAKDDRGGDITNSVRGSGIQNNIKNGGVMTWEYNGPYYPSFNTYLPTRPMLASGTI